MMNSLIIKVAGINVKINYLNASLKSFFRDYIVDDLEYDFEVTSTSDLIEKEKNISEYKNLHDSQYESSAFLRLISNELYKYNAVLFHSSVVMYEGNAYMFCAKSGTGKSTHTKNWLKYLGGGAKILNDDKPFIRIINDELFVYGNPWNGKDNLGINSYAKLKSLAFINRSQDNYIKKIDKNDSFGRLIQAMYRPIDIIALEKSIDVMKKMINDVNIYDMYCNMDVNSAKIAFEEMSKE